MPAECAIEKAVVFAARLLGRSPNLLTDFAFVPHADLLFLRKVCGVCFRSVVFAVATEFILQHFSYCSRDLCAKAGFKVANAQRSPSVPQATICKATTHNYSIMNVKVFAEEGLLSNSSDKKM